MTEVEQLLEDWVVLDRAVEHLRDDMSRYRSSVTIGMIRMCGSHAWRDQRAINRELWKRYVRVIGYAEGLVKYSLRGVIQTLAMDDQEIVGGVERYVDRVERMLDGAPK